MKIRSVIVDDDPYIREGLRDMIKEMNHQIEIIADFEHPLEAIEFIRQSKPELIFLDVQMPMMNGFELLDHLETENFEVIFITSFNQYAIQAIRYSALDYLLKPIQEADLGDAVDRFIKKSGKVLTQLKLKNLKHNLDQVDESLFQLVIPTKQGEFTFLANEILRCEADSNYTQIFLTEGRKFMASKTLGDIEEMLLGERFVRIHKSHLINMKFAIDLTQNDEVVLEDGSKISISRRRLSEVKSKIRHNY